MTFSKVMGVTNFSTVMGVADNDISKVMGIGIGGGTAVLLDGFESISGTQAAYQSSGYLWTAFALGSGTEAINTTTSHVTQGTFAWRMTASSMSAGNSTQYVNSSDFITGHDYSAYNTIDIDYFVNTLPSGLIYGWGAFDLGDFSGAQVATTATGAGTFTMNLNALTSKTNVAIVFSVNDIGGAGGGAYSMDCDNLRASTDSGAPVFMGISKTSQLVQNVTGSPVGSNNTVSSPGGLKVDDLLMMNLALTTGGSGTTTPSTPSGWTLLDSITSGVTKNYVYYKIADSGDVAASDFTVAVTVAATSGYVGTLLICNFRCANISAPFDSYGFDSVANFTSASSFNSTSLTTTVDNTVVGLFADLTPQPAPTYTPYTTGISPAGYVPSTSTNVFGSYDCIAFATKSMPSAGASGAATWNVSPNGNAGGAVAYVFRFAVKP